MARSVEAIVNPELLVWARTSGGYDVAQAAKKLRVTPERLEGWEQGRQRPTVAQLRRLAEVYKRPLAVFYLSKPPKNFDAMHDFRRMPGQISGIESPQLRLEIRRALYRREVALDLYNALEESPPQPKASAEATEDPEDIAQRMRALIDVSPEQQKNWKDENEAIRAWRTAIEHTGVLVFQARDVEPSEMLGFSFAEMPLPVIVVNIKDPPRRRIFTMFHELAHIMLGQNAICDLDEENPREPSDFRVEAFCNRIAGAALVPKAELLREELVADTKGPREWSDEELASIARHYWASREVVLRRLLILGRATQGCYERKRQEYQKDYTPRRKKTGFATPDRLVISTAGEPFVRLVLNGYANDRITSSDVADFLELRLKHIPRIEETLLRHSTSVGTQD
ncbi:MAG TPA: XRE family transcriptional regulator [Candidatus Binataceae bacterium]|nr:XRE family transcriptional regulator [Candidatus Binataceae bacterium]